MHTLLRMIIFTALSLTPLLARADGGQGTEGYLTVTTCLPFIGITWLGGTTTENVDALSSSTQQAAFGLLSLGISATAGGITTTFVIVNMARRAEAIIQVREDALRQAFAMGAGDAVDDLATWLALSGVARRRLGVLLRRDRARLIAVLDRPADLRRGWEFILELHRIESEVRLDLIHPLPAHLHSTDRR
jgi:hypothetical protein